MFSCSSSAKMTKQKEMRLKSRLRSAASSIHRRQDSHTLSHNTIALAGRTLTHIIAALIAIRFCCVLFSMSAPAAGRTECFCSEQNFLNACQIMTRTKFPSSCQGNVFFEIFRPAQRNNRCQIYSHSLSTSERFHQVN